MTDKELISKAFLAREKSYSPYSHFAVGAALLSKDGQVFRGCNIENAAYSPTNCAERTAFFKAVSEGVTEFEKIAIVGGPVGETVTDYAYPCGVCRQVMREFCNPESFYVISAISEDMYKKKLLKEILPDGFGPENLL